MIDTPLHDPPSDLINPPLLATDLLPPVEPPPVTPKTYPIMTLPTVADTANSHSLVHFGYTNSDPIIVDKFPDLLPLAEPPPMTPMTFP